jgi:hypothetical protein
MDMDYEKVGFGLIGIIVFFILATRLPPILMGGMARMMGAGRRSDAADEPERPAPRTARAPAARAPAARAPASDAPGFAREAVDAVDGDWDEISKVNTLLTALDARKQPVVAREGELLRSKLAWKIVAFEQAALQRVLALADGAVQLWNLRSVAGAVLCSRAVVETAAVLLDIARELGRRSAAGDLAAIDALLMQRAFGTALASLGDAAGTPPAVDLAGLIDAADREAPGTRARYDILVGLSAPDGLGQVRMAGEIDKSGTTVTFSETALFERGLLNQVAGGLQTLAVVQTALAEITALLPQVVARDEG